MHSKDKTQENFEILQRLFPNAVTETITGYDEDGKAIVERAIDKDVLQQEINAAVVEGKDERYQFTWPDKKRAIVSANAPINKTLRPCREESVDFDNTENLYIEGDNLEVLKLLQETYLGKIKMIYIDPPYNTGHDFVYNDKFSVSADEWDEMSGELDEYGNRLTQNTESNGRFHTDWLNMIYPRLKIARDLLTDDGVIFISIDDNELENLKKLCNEIFSVVNYQATITYVRKTSGKQDSTNFMKSTEYILVYSKSQNWDCVPLVAESNVTDRYNKEDQFGRYRETDLRKTGSGDRRQDRPLMWYPFYYNPLTDELQVRQSQDVSLENSGFVPIYPIKSDNSEGRWRWGYSTAVSNIGLLTARIMPKYKEEKKYTIYEKDYIDKKGDVRTVKEHTSWDRKEFNSDNAMQDLKKLGFSNQLFPFPKSTALIQHIIYLSDCANSIVLDLFSGSATTAHAVIRQNFLDVYQTHKGKRKFIMVQLPEKTDEESEAYKAGYKNICEIGKERIRRAGEFEKKNVYATAGSSLRWNEKRKAELGDDYVCPDDVDIGFRVLKLDSSNMKDVYYNPADFSKNLLDTTIDNIKEDRTPEDLLFQVMLDLGVLLSSKIVETEIAGKKVFNVADGFLIACFDNDVNEEVITAVAKQQPIYFVMRDSSLSSDTTATNFDQIFETYSPNTVRKVI